MKALITRGCTTDHGGIIYEADDSFIIEGAAVASNSGFMVVGTRTIVGNGDLSTCGARYIKNQDLVIRDGDTNRHTTASNSNEFLKQKNVFDEQIVAIDQDGQYLPNIAFYIETAEGEIYQGMTDSEGKTSRVTTNSSGELKIWLGDDAELMIDK